MPNDPFYSTGPWRKARAQCVRRHGYRCAWCDALCVVNGSSRVDHIKPRKQYPDLALDPANLRLLCTLCDARRHAEKGRRNGSGLHPGADAEGLPTDPAHHWNKAKGAGPPHG